MNRSFVLIGFVFFVLLLSVWVFLSVDKDPVWPFAPISTEELQKKVDHVFQTGKFTRIIPKGNADIKFCKNLAEDARKEITVIVPTYTASDFKAIKKYIPQSCPDISYDTLYVDGEYHVYNNPVLPAENRLTLEQIKYQASYWYTQTANFQLYDLSGVSGQPLYALAAEGGVRTCGDKNDAVCTKNNGVRQFGKELNLVWNAETCDVVHEPFLRHTRQKYVVSVDDVTVLPSGFVWSFIKLDGQIFRVQAYPRSGSSSLDKDFDGDIRVEALDVKFNRKDCIYSTYNYDNEGDGH